jgi:hypothetical protein
VNVGDTPHKDEPTPRRVDVTSDHKVVLGASSFGGRPEDVERHGQEAFVFDTTVLPINIENGCSADFVALGITFGSVIDDLFQEASLPEGWAKQPCSNAVWSEIVDGDGSVKIEVYFKAVYYDRHAFMRVKR